MDQSNDSLALSIEQKTKKGCERKMLTDKIVKGIFFFLASLCIIIVLVTLGYLICSGIQPFFKEYPSGEKLDAGYFFTGIKWEAGNYGVFWIYVNTLYLTLLSMVISIPLSVLTALCITRIAPKPIGELLNAVVTVLAGIPSVIIGVFGVGFICPMVRDFGNFSEYKQLVENLDCQPL